MMAEFTQTESIASGDLRGSVVESTEESTKSGHTCRMSDEVSKQNGQVSRPSSIAKRSLNSSQQSLNDYQPTMTAKDMWTRKSIHSLGLICISSLIIVALSLQLLFSIEGQISDNEASRTLLQTLGLYDDVMEVTTALITFAIMLDVGCFMLCSMQCYFATNILNDVHGEERACKYLRECSSSRFVAITGFFISIPTFLAATMLYVLLRFHSTPAVIAAVILSVGVVFCIIGATQNVYYWRIEKARAENGLPVYDKPLSKELTEIQNARNELSTLV